MIGEFYVCCLWDGKGASGFNHNTFTRLAAWGLWLYLATNSLFTDLIASAFFGKRLNSIRPFKSKTEERKKWKVSGEMSFVLVSESSGVQLLLKVKDEEI